MNKQCLRCEEHKPVTEFTRLRKRRGRNKSGEEYFIYRHHCKPCHSADTRERYASSPENRARRQAQNQAYIDRLVKETYAAYGNKCACCGELESKFFTIDHVDRNGNVERKANGKRTGNGFYSLLKGLGYPQDKYQLLCFNCNCGRERNNGICPHKA